MNSEEFDLFRSLSQEHQYLYLLMIDCKVTSTRTKAECPDADLLYHGSCLRFPIGGGT